eukprot:scaffold1386_cov342-Pavlova_lutheri.AAC.29
MKHRIQTLFSCFVSSPTVLLRSRFRDVPVATTAGSASRFPAPPVVARSSPPAYDRTDLRNTPGTPSGGPDCVRCTFMSARSARKRSADGQVQVRLHLETSLLVRISPRRHGRTSGARAPEGLQRSLHTPSIDSKAHGGPILPPLRRCSKSCASTTSPCTQVEKKLPHPCQWGMDGHEEPARAFGNTPFAHELQKELPLNPTTSPGCSEDSWGWETWVWSLLSHQTHRGRLRRGQVRYGRPQTDGNADTAGAQGVRPTFQDRAGGRVQDDHDVPWGRLDDEAGLEQAQGGSV